LNILYNLKTYLKNLIKRLQNNKKKQ